MLCAKEKHKTMTGRNMQFACRLLLTGDLAKHAQAEGTKAMGKYMATGPRHGIK